MFRKWWAWPWLSIQRFVSMWDLTSSSECSKGFFLTFIRLVGALRLHQNSAVLSKPAYEILKSYIYLKSNSVLSETEVISLFSHPLGTVQVEWKGLRRRKISLFLAACDWNSTAGEIRKTHQRNVAGSRISSVWWLNPSKQNFPPQKEVWEKKRIKSKTVWDHEMRKKRAAPGEGLRWGSGCQCRSERGGCC